jgi:hypothetical protein
MIQWDDKRLHDRLIQIAAVIGWKTIGLFMRSELSDLSAE